MGNERAFSAGRAKPLERVTLELSRVGGDSDHSEPASLTGMRSKMKSSMRIVLENTPRWVVSMRTSSAPCSQFSGRGSTALGEQKIHMTAD